jgi:thioredoxin reductase (NADPH)
MLGLTVQVVDSLPEIGGQCTALYPEKPIYDIPAWPRIEAAELIQHLEEQAAPFRPSYHLGHTVTALKKKDDHWLLSTADGQTFESRTIIIAAGGGAFGPNKPPLANLQDYEAKSVFYMVRRREDFRDQHVVIAGGGDSAVDWALSLSAIAAQVSLVHRRDTFRAAPESLRQLELLAQMGTINLCTPYQLKSLQGQDGMLQAVEITTMEGVCKILRADCLLAFFGLASDLGPIAKWGLDLDHHTVRVDHATCQTNAPGIYAIGDVAHYPEKLKLILTGFADAAQAAHAIRAYLNPGHVFHFEYSTTKGLPR